MEPVVSQALLAAVLGVIILVIVARLSRRGQLSFRYNLGWIGVASIGILAGLFIPLVEPTAEASASSASKISAAHTLTPNA